MVEKVRLLVFHKMWEDEMISEDECNLVLGYVLYEDLL